ncbi:MAG: dihydrofolate reductase [Sporolactobacillus sp.]
MISFLLAMDRNQLIGCGNKLPWHLPEDLRYFKQKTLGHSVVMGRKTFESIGKPLPGRRNVILSTQTDLTLPGVEVLHSVQDLIQSGISFGSECFVIGGAGVFDALMTYADRLYLTRIDAEFEGDVYFRSFIEEQWRLTSQTKGILDAENKYPHTFEVYERR